MDEETAYKLTVGQMREKIKEQCDKRIDCVGCPLDPESDEICFTGNDETVKENYAIMFNEGNSAADRLKEGMKKVSIPCDDEKVKEIKQYLSINSAVDHPAHYCYSKYEPKDVIRGWGLNFNLGSAVKYIARAGRKDDIIQDLEKAKKFLEFEIEALKLDRENGSDV